MFESAQRVSAMNSNFYYTEINMQRNFQQNSSQLPQTTPSSYAPPNDFYYGFGSMLRIPSPDPQNIEGLPIYHKLFFLDLSFCFQWLVNSLASTAIAARIQGNPLQIRLRHRLRIFSRNVSISFPRSNPCVSELFVSGDPGRAIKTASVPETFDKHSEPIEGMQASVPVSISADTALVTLLRSITRSIFWIHTTAFTPILRHIFPLR